MNIRQQSVPPAPLAPWRVGSVPYLNALPLTYGLEDQIHFAPPSQLVEMLRRDQLDAALVSVTEVLFNDRYEVLDGIAIASQGAVKSVLLAHRQPIERATEIFCDPASCTSINLLRVLLAERGLRPKLTPLSDYRQAATLDYVLLIGNPAIDFSRAQPAHQLWDLGAAWQELTGLPFVYAIWALQRDRPTSPLRQRLRQARDEGLAQLDRLVHERSEYDLAFRKAYLGGHIRYQLGPKEKQGLARFIELLRQHGVGPVYEPRFVN